MTSEWQTKRSPNLRVDPIKRQLDWRIHKPSSSVGVGKLSNSFISICSPGHGNDVGAAYWIGATDKSYEGEFHWTDSLPFSFTSKSANFSLPIPSTCPCLVPHVSDAAVPLPFSGQWFRSKLPRFTNFPTVSFRFVSAATSLACVVRRSFVTCPPHSGGAFDTFRSNSLVEAL